MLLFVILIIWVNTNTNKCFILWKNKKKCTRASTYTCLFLIIRNFRHLGWPKHQQVFYTVKKQKKKKFTRANIYKRLFLIICNFRRLGWPKHQHVFYIVKKEKKKALVQTYISAYFLLFMNFAIWVNPNTNNCWIMSKNGSKFHHNYRNFSGIVRQTISEKKTFQTHQNDKT